MTEKEILAEVKKAIDFKLDGTYEISDLYSHILTIIKENSAPAQAHKHQMERLMYKVDEMRENQRLFWAGHKQKIGLCKKQEAEMDSKINHLQTMGYDFSRFKNKAIQNTLL